MRLPFIFVVSTLLVSQCGSLLAEQADNRAHQHGIARLEVLKLATDLQISLYATGSDILGFEHQPKNHTEEDKVKKVRTLLAHADKLFNVNGTNCSFEEYQSNLTELENDIASGSEHTHEHSHQDDHKHEGHHDIEATYRFKCNATNDPVTIKVNLFKFFADLQTIHSSWITETGQSAASLTPSDNQLALE